MTVRQGPVGSVTAQFVWDSGHHHCEGGSVLAWLNDGLRVSPKIVTACVPQFCTPTLSRILSLPGGDTLHVEWSRPENGPQLRSFTFTRIP